MDYIGTGRNYLMVYDWDGISGYVFYYFIFCAISPF